MIKNLFTPIQAWLLSQGRCVGCGELLARGKKQEINQKKIVSCRCGRMFVDNHGTYRRALFNEI
ncbi:MAG: hypothetical protein NTY75_02270 [Candidatus Shapirobacteria bacterium]|nr:hypothetical protein [Candidatus Shapirobacteria bacterium]